MVDAATAPDAGDDRLRVRVTSARDGGALDRYRQAGAGLTFAPPQAPRWVEAWQGATGTDMVVAELACDRRTTMALALEIVAKGPLRVARFSGGSHANGNFPAIDPDHPPSRAALVHLTQAIARARPDIDILALERLLPALGGHANPLAALGAAPSADIALSADLSGGFDALLSRVSGKRKRKKHRSQERKFEAAGGYRLVRAQTIEEADRLLDAFFAMRAARLAETGVPNAFADNETQEAFRALFGAYCGMEEAPFVLQALEVGGRLRAVSGASRRGDTIVCEFTGFAHDELADAAPGDFLFFETIRDACEEGFAVYDFSVGDERYKREWCGIETRPFDTIVTLTAKGRLAGAAWRALSASKRRVKDSATATDAVKRLRRALGGAG